MVNTENTHFVNIDLESGKYIPSPEISHKKEFHGVEPKRHSGAVARHEEFPQKGSSDDNTVKIEAPKSVPGMTDRKSTVVEKK